MQIRFQYVHIPLRTHSDQPLLLQKSKLKGLLVLVIVILCMVCAGSSRVGAQQDLKGTATITIIVTSLPSRAEVFLDSVSIGLTPLSFSVDRKQRHLLKVERNEYVPYYRWIPLDKDTVDFSAVLKPNYSWLTVRATPQDAQIIIDDSISVASQEITRVATGFHTVRVENHQRSRWLERRMMLNPADTVSFEAVLGAKSIIPTALSILVPGAGQMYDRSTLKGIGFFLGTFTAAYIAMQADKNHDDAFRLYQDSYALYLNASTEESASKLRAETLTHLDEANSAARRKNWFLAITTVLYAANIIDVVLFHNLDDDIEFNPNSSNVKLTPVVSADQIHVGFVINF